MILSASRNAGTVMNVDKTEYAERLYMKNNRDTNDDRKLIRFIDSRYNDLFYIPDGENIVLTDWRGEKSARKCTYLDECHTQIGSNVFHICQFAEICERNGTKYEPEIPQKLPERCYSVLPRTGELIIITKGKQGYDVSKGGTDNRFQNRQYANERNHSLRVMPQQEAAMLGGATKGWRTKAAKVTSYDIRGKPIAPEKKKSKEQER